MTVRMSGIGGSGMDTEAMIEVMVNARIGTSIRMGASLTL